MQSLKRVKSANKQFKRAKSIVFGYLHENEKELKIKIPEEIKYICLDLYLLTDNFTAHGDDIKLNEGKDTASLDMRYPGCDFGRDQSIYGDIIIDGSDESILEYHWKFRIL